MNALRDIRRLEKMELNVATAARLINNPRIITPADFRGVVDLRPGGQTVGSIKGRDNNPYEWASGGDPRFLIDERNRKEEVVESRFHRQLFTQFSELERQITAREVEAREREKLMRFSPSFTLLVNELLTPMLQRVFMLLFKAGKLPPHPAEAEVTDSANQTYMLFPSIVQTSRMAQAITAAQTEGMMALGEMFSPFPETFDNLDRDKLFRHTARARHLGSFLFSESDVENKRRADAEAAAQQQQMAMLLEASKSKPVAEAGIAALQS